MFTDYGSVLLFQNEMKQLYLSELTKPSKSINRTASFQNRTDHIMCEHDFEIHFLIPFYDSFSLLSLSGRLLFLFTSDCDDHREMLP